MKQCNSCWMVLPGSVDNCTYCQNADLRVLDIRDRRYEGLKIYLKKIEIQGEKYDVIEVINSNSKSTVLKLKKGEKFYALKVSLKFNQYFTNNSGLDKYRVGESDEILAREILILNKIINHIELKIFYAGKLEEEFKGKRALFHAILMECAETTYDKLMACFREGGYLPETEKKNTIHGVLQSLKLFHEIGIHRDLSLDNIFVLKRDNKIEYTIGDFGSAKTNEDAEESKIRGVTKEPGLAYHPGYGPPEVMNMETMAHNDKRMDVYSNGLILLEIITGIQWKEFSGYEYEKFLSERNFEKNVYKKYYRNVLGKKTYKFFKKVIAKNKFKRFKSGKEFLELYEKKILNKEKVRLLARKGKKIIRIIIEGNMPTLFKEEHKIDYTGNNFQVFDKLCNIRINFVCFEDIIRVKLRGQKIYYVEFNENTIWLKIDKNYIRNAFGDLLLFNESRGKMILPLELEFEYFQR